MSDEVRLVAVSEHDLQQMGAFAEIIDWDAGITEEEARLDAARAELDARAGSTLAQYLRPLRASLAAKLRAALNPEECE